MNRNKKIFISDIHMGTEESIQSNPAYGWLLKDRADLLAEFLDRLADDDHLAELVILGDLFDEWVVPYSTSPLPSDKKKYANQFKKIAAAPQNQPIIKALNQLADTDGICVTYVPGNHDMLMESDIIKELFPKVHAVIESCGKGVYSSGKIAAEHGSYYCLFNAPDSYDNPGHNLPLGFFVARSQAQGYMTGHPITKKIYLKILLETLNKLLHEESFADAVFESIVSQIHSPTDAIVMHGLDNYPSSVQTEEVSKIFKDLAGNWKKKMPGNVPAPMPVLGEIACLFPAVLDQYTLPYFEKRKTENVVVLGHTHCWEIKGVSLGLKSLIDIGQDLFRIVESLKKGQISEAVRISEDFSDPGPRQASDFIYANSGTWIDGDGEAPGKEKPPATYVVIDEEGERTTVEIRSYTGGDPAGSRLLESRFTMK